MTKDLRFTIRIDHSDRKHIETVSRNMERCPSDTIRWLVRNAAKQLQADQDTNQDKKLSQPPTYSGANS